MSRRTVLNLNKVGKIASVIASQNTTMIAAAPPTATDIDVASWPKIVSSDVRNCGPTNANRPRIAAAETVFDTSPKRKYGSCP